MNIHTQGQSGPIQREANFNKNELNMIQTQVPDNLKGLEN